MGFLAFFDWLSEKRRKPERAGALQPVGFWWSENEPWLPRPADAVAADWSHTERAAVIDHLLRPEDFKQYMGLSHCRMCDRLVGSREFTDGTWVWPEGLVHYLDLHDVRPPDDFVAWVLANSEAAAGRLACPYSRDRGVGPLPKAWRRHTHFETRDRAVHPEERARRAAEQAAAKLEEQEWIDAAPASLRSLVATNSIDFATIRVARESVLVEHRGDDMPALLALLKWCAAGTGEWRSPLREPFMASVIGEFPQNLVVAALESGRATDAVYAGAARYVSYWALGRKSGAARDWVPARLHPRLRAAAIATGVQKNIVALDTALGYAQEAGGTEA